MSVRRLRLSRLLAQPLAPLGDFERLSPLKTLGV
jgi:hypothetical protein